MSRKTESVRMKFPFLFWTSPPCVMSDLIPNSGEIILCTNGTVWNYDEGLTLQQEEITKLFRDANITVEALFPLFDNSIFLSNDKKLYCFLSHNSYDLWDPVPGDCKNLHVCNKSILQVFPVRKHSCCILRLEDKKWYRLSACDKILPLDLPDSYESCHGYSNMQDTDWGDTDTQIAIFDQHVYFQGEGDRKWHHISFFDDKNPKNVVATVDTAYVHCDDGFYYFGEDNDIYFVSPEDEENHVRGESTVVFTSLDGEDGEEGEDKDEGNVTISKFDFFTGRTVHKLLSYQLVVYCWCDTDLYFWDDEWPDVDGSDIREELGNPIRFFSDKTILDIAECFDELFVLTTDGIYTLGQPDVDVDGADRSICKVPHLSAEENLPSFFSNYRQYIRFLQKKRALQVTEEDQEAENPPKKQATEINRTVQ